MDYNSNRKKLPLPEYGRNIQNMVDHVLTIENREERNLAARTIIDIMGNLYPYLRDINDFKHKLWDHLAIMADFKLDIDYPYDPPRPETFQEAPKKVEYASNNIRFRYYGKVLERMVDEAAAYEDGEEKEILITMLANHMKKCYLTWNKDAVDDEKIYLDLEEISKGKVKRDNLNLAETRDILQRSAPRKKQNTQGRNPKKHRKND
ncbi:DUF4290 domain-containing protein [Sunxiuqinia elliptica]|uniref:Uncharacterized protein DUF4290 n=1 Tax=Sunxiuqinia elliptica TaxID=655355 RepID=A0A1I2FGV6_9BACT|nr:DUF4290 domain-containing protein [Sunxiuqinia elliptica]TDO05181.1 uncharacterized protein DUF4290 [Sunxiuqinia elliptica]TDO64730.1 uncharacterized protein DUF4290 [Sunxiuqinia elliptica]SFF03977.1 protein of unknown function [Sunxiuqinia elliptica]